MGPSKSTERLQSFLAHAGIASRRGVVGMIERGLVKVNGKVVREKGFHVRVREDRVTVGRQQVRLQEAAEKHYLLFHKPKGVVTTLRDPHAKKTVAHFFKKVPARLFPVGRLDRDTTGLLLMTDDGPLNFRLTHPKFGVFKEYHVTVAGPVPPAAVARLRRGIDLGDFKTAPCEVRVEKKLHGMTTLVITLHEGKKRQIRRMFDAVGAGVLALKRFRFGPLSLGDLKPGEWRPLSPGEIRKLKAAAG